MISKQELKSLKQITPISAIARPTLKTQKSIKNEINDTICSAFYKISKLVSKDLKTFTCQGKLYIKDVEEFINKIKNETLNKNEKDLKL